MKRVNGNTIKYCINNLNHDINLIGDTIVCITCQHFWKKGVSDNST